MGDTISLINFEERVPFLVGAGFTNPGIRFGISPPDNGFVYGLSDVAILRLLFPGEVFVTVPTIFPNMDQDLQSILVLTMAVPRSEGENDRM